MRNSICMFSFPSSHICFSSKNICCSDWFGGFVSLLSVFTFQWKISKTIKVFHLQDYQSLLYFSKTIRVFYLAETINVICSLLFKYYQSLLSCGDYQFHLLFTFQRLLKSFVLWRLSMSSALYFSKTLMSFVKTITVFFTFQGLQCLLSRLSQSYLYFKDFNVFCQDYHSLLYISKTSMSFVKTITVFFTSQRLPCLLSRLSQSSLHFKDYQSVLLRLSQSSLLFQDYQSLLSYRDYQCLLLFKCSKTIRVFCFKDYQSLLSRLQCLLYFSRLQGLLFDVPDTSYILSFDRLHYLGFR